MPETYQYSVKMINQLRKSTYDVQKFRVNMKFSTISMLKEELVHCFPDRITKPPDQVCYIQPGHGVRGKQRWLSSDQDLKDMYIDYLGKKEIILWTYVSLPDDTPVPKASRSTSPDDSSPVHKKKRLRSEATSSTLSEVEEIVQDLKRIHGDNYTVEQLRTWAHLIQMGKHVSKETPPNKPFFQSCSKSKIANPGSEPQKMITMRGECINQLKKWHELLQAGAITQVQYDDLQGKILLDINKL